MTQARPNGSQPRWRSCGGAVGASSASIRCLAGRANEALDATFDEFDLATGLWAIPAERMKMRLEHRILLPHQALDIVRAPLQRAASCFRGAGVTHRSAR